MEHNKIDRIYLPMNSFSVEIFFKVVAIIDSISLDYRYISQRRGNLNE